jgi:hypothetical protein
MEPTRTIETTGLSVSSTIVTVTETPEIKLSVSAARAGNTQQKLRDVDIARNAMGVIHHFDQ